MVDLDFVQQAQDHAEARGIQSHRRHAVYWLLNTDDGHRFCSLHGFIEVLEGSPGVAFELTADELRDAVAERRLDAGCER